MTDLPFTTGDDRANLGAPQPRRCVRHRWVKWGQSVHVETDSAEPFASVGLETWEECERCHRRKDKTLVRRGAQSRRYGNAAELKAARTYGGEKVGHHGGPVDIRGKDWNVQVKTHRRQPPAEWTKAFAGMAASTDRLPRLLLRFVRTGGQEPIDYFVVPAKAWLDWHGRDE